MDLTRVTFLNSGHCRQWSRFAGRPNWKWDRFYAVFVFLEHPQHGPALIDTGYSDQFFSATLKFPQRLYRWMTPVTLDRLQGPRLILQRQGIAAEDIKSLFVSHFHADHVAGLRDFPKARFIYRGDAFEKLGRANVFRQVHHGFLQRLLPGDFVERGESIDEQRFRPGTGALREFSTLDFWNDGSLLFVDLPGHALGHMGFVLRTRSWSVFYIVDACWDIDVLLQGRALPRLARRFQSSFPAYVETQEKLRRLGNHRELTLLACHCPRTQRHVANPEH
jgi:glyoxylase-like metal-dependent hydrolase (beta-lactamase superfamily II)